MLELGAPVVGPHAARYQPSRGRQTRSLCVKYITLEPGGVNIFNRIALIHPARFKVQCQRRDGWRHRAATVARAGEGTVRGMVYYFQPPRARYHVTALTCPCFDASAEICVHRI